MATTAEIDRIMVQLTRAFDGEAWHGPAVLELLSDVDAKTAAARPIPGAHTIWELTMHIQGWEGVIRRRLGGEALTLSEDEDFPKIKDTSEAAWQAALEGLRREHKALLDVVSKTEDERLSEKVPGKNYNVYFMLHGAVQHALYHAGQIAVLKKARK
ncbi:MAG TPA: DinB family protein [Terriglobales bacterium]|jgi:uncharacterized damage-inducible protein DinB